MNQQEPRRTRVTANKWALAELFDAHPASVHSWQKHEGLGVALISPGGPGSPALFDGARAIEWFRREKLRAWETAPTLKGLKAIVARMATPAGPGRQHLTRRGHAAEHVLRPRREPYEIEAGLAKQDPQEETTS